MATRVQELAVQIRDDYEGDAARVWTDAGDTDQLRANLAALPGFGEMKIKSLGAVLAKRFGVGAAEGLCPRIRPSATSTRRRRWPTIRRPSARTRPNGAPPVAEARSLTPRPQPPHQHGLYLPPSSARLYSAPMIPSRSSATQKPG